MNKNKKWNMSEIQPQENINFKDVLDETIHAFQCLLKETLSLPGM